MCPTPSLIISAGKNAYTRASYVIDIVWRSLTLSPFPNFEGGVQEIVGFALIPASSLLRAFKITNPAPFGREKIGRRAVLSGDNSVVERREFKRYC